MLRSVITFFAVISSFACIQSQPLTKAERKWLMETIGDPRSSASVTLKVYGVDSVLNFLTKNDNRFADRSELFFNRAYFEIERGDDKKAFENMEQIPTESREANFKKLLFYKGAAYLVQGDRKYAGEMFRKIKDDSDWGEDSKKVIKRFGL